MEECLRTRFPDSGSQLLGYNQVPKVTFPSEPDYAKVKHTYGGSMYPAVVVYVEDDEEVIDVLKCAYDNGFQVSARGRGHQYQGLSTMHGHVIIDMSLTCNPEDFEIDRNSAGNHILEGQKYIATMKVQAGCTTSVITASVHNEFDPTEGALSIIGGCPSVGLVGFVLGGGSGDTTPWVGWATDIATEFDVILYNGTKVVANENENPDLFWALRGGGGGFGVVTSLTQKVVQAPPPMDPSKDRKYTFVNVAYNTSTPEKLDKFLITFQDFLYEFDPVKSAKFGGQANINTNNAAIYGLYLGSWQEFLIDWTEAGLLDPELLVQENGSLWENYDVKCSNSEPCDVDGFPSFGKMDLKEFHTYGESMAYKLCGSGAGVSSFFGTQRSSDVCSDLGIDAKYCFPIPGSDGNKVDCTPDKEIYDAILTKMLDPESYLNRHGGNFDKPSNSAYGGIVFTKLEHETMVDLANIGFKVFHFQHGAPMHVAKKEAALPWRDTAIMTQFRPFERELRGNFISRLAQDAAYGGDADNINGYYNYMFPGSDTNFGKFYFDDHYHELQQIRGRYDPLDRFGKPFYVESVPTKAKAGKKTKSSKSSKSSKASKASKNGKRHLR